MRQLMASGKKQGRGSERKRNFDYGGRGGMGGTDASKHREWLDCDPIHIPHPPSPDPKNA